MKTKKILFQREYHSEGMSLGRVDVILFQTEGGSYLDWEGKPGSIDRAAGFYQNETRGMNRFTEKHSLEVVEQF